MTASRNFTPGFALSTKHDVSQGLAPHQPKGATGVTTVQRSTHTTGGTVTSTDDTGAKTRWRALVETFFVAPWLGPL